jgi:hypothetical protein
VFEELFVIVAELSETQIARQRSNGLQQTKRSDHEQKKAKNCDQAFYDSQTIG